MMSQATAPDLDVLTDKQRQIYEFVRAKIRDRGYGPTVREIGNEFGIRSPDGVMCHLKALQKKGLIHRVNDMAQDVSRVANDRQVIPMPPQAVDLIEEIADETHQDAGRVAHLSAELYRLAIDARGRGERLAFIGPDNQIVQEVTGLLPGDDDDVEVS
jgi:SOS-response transcriptional repressor LexA